MADVIEMIQLSPTMEEGVLVEWMKNEGDAVEEGEVLAEVETDKATMEMESFYDGVLLKVLVPAGDAAPVGAPLAIIGEEGEDVSELIASLASGGAAPAAAPAEEPAAADAAPAPAAAAPAAAPAAAAAPGGRVLSSPMARKIAADKGIDLSQVAGTGPAGRIVKRDVETFVPSAAPAAAAAPVVRSAVPGESIRLSPMRKAIAKNLSAAWQAPAFMLTRQVAMDAAMKFRKELNEALVANDQPKVSVNDVVLKACAKALIDVPEMNAAYQGDELLFYKSADIGVAVALEGGLITPIIRGAESKSLAAIGAESKALAARARDKKLEPHEYSGATFSVSNLGMFGVDHFTAVLNPPAAGILAVGATKKVPVVDDNGELAVGLRMNVTLTCDHRTVDGAVGARWLQRFALYMESPLLLLV